MIVCRNVPHLAGTLGCHATYNKAARLLLAALAHDEPPQPGHASGKGAGHCPAVKGRTGCVQVQGMDDFGGLQMHAHNYRSNSRFKGQRVIVVGSSFSGVAVALVQLRHAFSFAAQLDGIIVFSLKRWRLCQMR